MKYNKLLLMCMGVASLLVATSCNDDDNPSIDDYPLNYEITEVKAHTDIPVGCMLVDPYGDLSNAARWERLTEESDKATGHLGPNVMPSLGQYRLLSANPELRSEIAQNLGQIVEWAKKASIDYLITPAIRESGQYLPHCIHAEDSVFIDLLSGRDQTQPWHNDGSMKFAIQVNIQDISAKMGCNSNTAPLENRNDITYRIKQETEDAVEGEEPIEAEEIVVTITQRERFLNYMRSIAKYFKEDTYYHYEGRPVLLFREPHQLHTLDIKQLYADIRSVIQGVCGENPYIIAIQENWKPIARYSYVVLDGGPDAVMPREMTNIGDAIYERLYKFGVFLNENFKLNRQYLERAYPGIEYIPSVSAAFNYYICDGRFNYPIIENSESGFRERCWVAKMNLPANPMVIIDAFNNWRYGNAIEPTDPNYGNGWGDTYLDIVREEFKLNR